MLRLFILAAAVLGLVASAHAQTRMYKCTDAKGKVYVTQTPPAECLGRPTDMLNSRGVVIQRAEGQLSTAEIARREAEKKKKAEQEVQAREERRRATALLNTYSSEKDVEDARQRHLRDNEEAIKQTDKRISEALKRKKQLENEKEFYVKSSLPAKLKQDIQNNEIELKTQQEVLDSKKKQISTINAKFDEDKKRYVELTRTTSKR